MRAREHVSEEFRRARQSISLLQDRVTLLRDELDPLFAAPVQQLCDLAQGHAGLLALDRDGQGVEQRGVVAAGTAGRARRMDEALGLPVTKQVGSDSELLCCFTDAHGSIVVDFVSTRTSTFASMRIHELNCGTLNAPGGTTVYGSPHFICRVLLIEDGHRLIAVDTGIGHEGCKAPEARLGSWWLSAVAPALDPSETLRSRIVALGLDPRHLSDVILTHHHRDHVDGLADFPSVRVHASDVCRAAVAEGDRGLVPVQWEHGVTWAPSPIRTSKWHGLDTYLLDGLPESIRLVDLVGHSPGHSGVLIEDLDDGSLLHVGDAIHHCSQLSGKATPALEAFARASQHNEHDRLATITKLAALAATGRVRAVNAHDPHCPAG